MVRVTTHDPRAGYVEEFRRLEHELAGHDRRWIAELRRRAIERFAEIGFPGAKDEAWKYTSVAPLLKSGFRSLPPTTVADRPLDDANVAATKAAMERIGATGDPVALFVDGRFVSSWSSDAAGRGVALESLAQRVASDGDALAQHLARYVDPGVHGFAALNTAFAVDGPVVRLARGTAAARPIHLVMYSSKRAEPYVCHPRVLVLVEDGASARIVEHWIGAPDAVYLTNAVTEVSLGRDASLEHVKLQGESDAASHVHRIQVAQCAGSSLRSHSIALGAALSRTEITTVLGGEQARCELFGLYLASGDRHVDHHTTIDHSFPRTTSREVYKGILDDRSRGVFTGKVYVRPDAQQIVAEQSNKNLLLSQGAMVETRPQLEIYADDVKCTHGAAIGRLDDEALFYMRQRGIDAAAARSLLTYAFASEVLDAISIEGLRRALASTVSERLGRGSALDHGGEGATA